MCVCVCVCVREREREREREKEGKVCVCVCVDECVYRNARVYLRECAGSDCGDRGKSEVAWSPLAVFLNPTKPLSPSLSYPSPFFIINFFFSYSAQSSIISPSRSRGDTGRPCLHTGTSSEPPEPPRQGKHSQTRGPHRYCCRRLRPLPPQGEHGESLSLPSHFCCVSACVCSLV